MRESKYSELSDGIKITSTPEAIEEECDAADSVFAFAYTIKIENLTSSVVQLIERHWIIKSAEIQIGEVSGPGVVGEQPILKPGQSFEYTSSAVINDPVGSMEGEYIFRKEDGGIFQVKIPRFELCLNRYLH